jgi:hypothetical protein
MEALWQYLMEISARHITPHGFYIPGEPYKLILWNELIVIILSFVATIQVFKIRFLRRRLARLRDISISYDRIREKQRRRNTFTCMEESEALNKIMEGMEWFDVIQIVYMDFKGEITIRAIEPLKVYCRDGHYYLEAFCRLRGDERNFRLDRMIVIEPTDDVIPYAPPNERYGVKGRGLVVDDAQG